MTFRAIGIPIAALLVTGAVSTARAETPAELISGFRLKHGEIAVVRDSTLDRIALDQARAMAAKDTLSHETLGSFSSRIAPSQAGRAAENIAYGYERFDKTLDQWINSSEHRKNLLLSKATRVGIASAVTANGKRTYWAMEIAGDYEPKGKGRDKGKDKGGRVIAADAKEGLLVKREVSKRDAATERKSGECRLKLLSLCF